MNLFSGESSFYINMKPVQILIDEKLLEALDADEEVKNIGRSAVLRRIVREYLEGRRRKAVAEGYRRAYGRDADGLGAEFGGWEDEGLWPEK